ncbi:MAG: beta-agarase [Opitutae bacterium]|nr:beta-agarase [Opitutae bacterium]
MHLKRTYFPQGGLGWFLIIIFLNLDAIQLNAAKPDTWRESDNFSLANIDGRHWLLSPDGTPFFAHGITHAGNRLTNLDFQKFSEACKELGFNAYGYGCPQQLRKDMPYLASWNHLVPISYYRGKNGVKFVDLFDPKVEARLEAGVNAYCRINAKTSRNVIGYCWTDLGSWPLENPSGSNWVDFIRNLPKNTPGQKAYQSFMERWKGDVGKVCDQAFLRIIAREYFRIIGEAQRKYAPDHLIFGDRFAFNTLDPDVMKEMLPYVDGIAIQPPFHGKFPKEKFAEIHKLTQKPILICDFAIRFKDGDKDIRNWKPAADSIAAGQAYAEYVTAALKTDYIVGVFWCNPVDTSKGFGKPGVKQGFFGKGMSERPGLHQSVKKLNAYRDKVTPKQ